MASRQAPYQQPTVIEGMKGIIRDMCSFVSILSLLVNLNFRVENVPA